MRKETDKFFESDTGDFIQADSSVTGVGIECLEAGCDSSIVVLTKQQARKFAKQILEMTGDEDESVQ